MADHGTNRRYAEGCKCAACKRAHADNIAGNRAGHAARTMLAARHGAPWTAREDSELLTGTGTLTERALRLERTRAAVDTRLARLRQQGGDMTP